MRSPFKLMAIAGMLGVAAMRPTPIAADATQADMQAIATAMELVFLDTNFITTLENLDDTTTFSSLYPHQSINNGGGALVLRPSVGTFEPVRRDLVNTALAWQGPYLALQGGRLDDAESEYDPYTILDLWGNPYYFYSPLGLIDPRAEDVTQQYYGDAFDRYMIVSHGPDGIKSSDDIGWQLGLTAITVAQASVAIFYPSETRDAAYELEIRGYNLGATQGTGAVQFDGTDTSAVTITEWTPTRVLATFTELPIAGTQVRVRANSGQLTRTVSLTPGGSIAAVGEWLLY